MDYLGSSNNKPQHLDSHNNNNRDLVNSQVRCLVVVLLQLHLKGVTFRDNNNRDKVSQDYLVNPNNHNNRVVLVD